MTAPLSNAEARRMTKCPDCGHRWTSHRDLINRDLQEYCWAKGCVCTRGDETLTQVAALVAEREAAVLVQAEQAILADPTPNTYNVGYRDGWIDGSDQSARIVRGLIPEGGAPTC